MKLASLLLATCLGGCAVDLPEAGPQARECLKAGYERDGLVQWHCADGKYYWIPDRRAHK
jgi:hypothetical protein